MSSNLRIYACALLLAIICQHQCRALPIPSSSEKHADSTGTELSTEVTTVPSSSNTTAIDTLSESEGGLRVKRNGCGCCGCGCCCPCCCCCRPCCCCCRPCCCCRCCRCCTCCRTCCCTCCRPCCCGCCGCGCCGCGGGRKRRALQALKIKLADKLEKENRFALPFIPSAIVSASEEQLPSPQTETGAESQKPETFDGNQSEKVAPATTTEWPEPVFELVTETSRQ